MSAGEAWLLTEELFADTPLTAFEEAEFGDWMSSVGDAASPAGIVSCGVSDSIAAVGSFEDLVPSSWSLYESGDGFAVGEAELCAAVMACCGSALFVEGAEGTSKVAPGVMRRGGS